MTSYHSSSSSRIALSRVLLDPRQGAVERRPWRSTRRCWRKILQLSTDPPVNGSKSKPADIGNGGFPGLTRSKRLEYGRPQMDAIVVVTTVGTEQQANHIAQELVARRHAACVNIIPGVRSFFRWQGRIRKDGELVLIIKTAAEEFESVRDVIHELLDYDLPEVLAFEISRGDAPFLEWIFSSLDKEADFDDTVEFDVYGEGEGEDLDDDLEPDDDDRDDEAGEGNEDQ
ncbi:MAG: divalent-cation tolerance protein CutA [Acidobacteriota bacterium]